MNIETFFAFSDIKLCDKLMLTCMLKFLFACRDLRDIGSFFLLLVVRCEEGERRRTLIVIRPQPPDDRQSVNLTVNTRTFTLLDSDLNVVIILQVESKPTQENVTNYVYYILIK